MGANGFWVGGGALLKEEVDEEEKKEAQKGRQRRTMGVEVKEEKVGRR